MTQPERPRNRLAEFAVLGAAVAIAIGVAVFFLAGGSGSEADAPDAVVKNLYAAVAKDDATAFQALLDPALADSPVRAIVPFPQAVGAYNVGQGVGARIADLTVRVVNNEAGWASVGARGTVTIANKATPFNETVYLRSISGQWRVSTEAEFTRANTNPGTKPSAVAADLGPIGPGRPKDGELAPDFALIDARDGVTVRKLSDFRGKAVILNFYASWCGPCKAEIPEFQDAYAALGNELVVFGVDVQESPERARGILDIFKAKYPAVVDSSGSVGERYRASVLPSTFFIDKDGVLRVTKFGQVRKTELADLLAKVGVTYVPPD